MFYGFCSAAEKRLSDLKQYDWSFDVVAEWLSATEARMSSIITSVPSSADDARDTLDACHTCLEELLQKRKDLDSVAGMAHALHHSGVYSSRTVVELNSQYSLITTKLKVIKCWLHCCKQAYYINSGSSCTNVGMARLRSTSQIVAHPSQTLSIGSVSGQPHNN